MVRLSIGSNNDGEEGGKPKGILKKEMRNWSL